MKLKKCIIFTKMIDCLGNVMKPCRLALIDHTTEAVSHINLLRNVTKLKYLLASCKVYLQFVPHWACKAGTLSKSLKKGGIRTIGNLTQEEQEARATFQDKLVFTSVLALPGSKRNLIPDTDACKMKVGCDSMKEQSDET